MWVYLIVLTGVEVVLAYVHVFPPAGMLVMLMVLSLVKAALIVTYFMHLRFERASLVLSLIPSVVVVISLLFMFFPIVSAFSSCEPGESYEALLYHRPGVRAGGDARLGAMLDVPDGRRRARPGGGARDESGHPSTAYPGCRLVQRDLGPGLLVRPREV